MIDSIYMQLSASGRQTTSLILKANIVPLEIADEQLACNRILQAVLGDCFCILQYCVRTIKFCIFKYFRLLTNQCSATTLEHRKPPPCVSSSFAIHPPAAHSLICSLPCQSNVSVQQTILSRHCGTLPVPGTDSRYRECIQTALNHVFCFVSFFSPLLFLEGKCLVSGMGRREESTSQLIINALW